MLKTLLPELRRRNVLPTIVPYIGLIWLLLQVVSVIQPMLNLSPLVGTFTSIALFAGFPVVLYLSWYFNFTMHGLEPIGHAETGEISRFGLLKWTILLVIMSGSGSLGYMYFGEVREELVKKEQGILQITNAKSIAVLPFRDQSPDQDQRYITEGLTEELTALLGKTSKLRVAAASSAFALVEQNLTPMDIGRRLNVDTLVTGSLRVTGNRLKIRTELIDSQSGMTLWTETFTREFKDIFAVEEEIGRSIVNLLEDRYLEVGEVTSAAKTAVTDAYVMYLKGRQQYRKQTTESIKSAREFFQQALALDPEYVLAYVALADTLLLLEKGQSRFGILDTDIAVTLADQQLNKAFVREQNNAEAYAIQGKVFELNQDFDAAISSFDKAISINSSLAIAHMWKFLVLKKTNQHKSALISIKEAFRLDPASLTTAYNMGMELSFSGNFAEAEKIFLQLVDENIQSPFGHAGLANNYFMQGELAKSAYHWSKASKISPENDNYYYGFLDSLLSLQLTEMVRLYDRDSTYEWSLLVLEERADELFPLIEFEIKANPDDPFLKFELAWYQMLLNKAEIAAQTLIGIRDQFSAEDLFSMPLCSPAIEIAWALKRNDKIVDFQAMLTKCETAALKAAENDITDSHIDHLLSRIYALKEQQKKSNQYLQKAVSNGWLQWWTSKDPLLSSLSGNEEAQRLFDIIEKTLAKERLLAKSLFSSDEPNKTKGQNGK